jgi:F0F1-type ATP synthase assembly protein I
VSCVALIHIHALLLGMLIIITFFRLFVIAARTCAASFVGAGGYHFLPNCVYPLLLMISAQLLFAIERFALTYRSKFNMLGDARTYLVLFRCSCF